MKFLLLKSFVKNIWRQKFVTLIIILITSFSSLFSVGIIGYYFSTKNSFSEIANKTNTQIEVATYSNLIQRYTKNNPNDLSIPNCRIGNPGLDCVMDILKNPKILNKIPEVKNLAMQKNYQIMGAQITYNLNSLDQSTTTAVVVPATLYDEKRPFSDNNREAFNYNKLYTLDKNRNYKVLDGKKLNAGHCYVSPTWAIYNHIKVGDYIKMGGGDNKLQVDGFANTLNNFSPTTGSILSVFGTPTEIPAIFVNSAINFKNYFNNFKEFGQSAQITKFISFSKVQNNIQSLFFDKKWYKNYDKTLHETFYAPGADNLKTFYGKFYVTTNFNNFLSLGFVNYFLWNSMLNVYLMAGVSLSLVFWVLSVIILFVMLKRNVQKEKGNLATLKALGYKNNSLSFYMVIFPIFITFFSVLIGFLSGYFFQFFLRSEFLKSFDFNVFITIPWQLGLAVSALLLVFTNLLGFWYVKSKLDKYSAITLMKEKKVTSMRVISFFQPLTNKLSFKYKFSFLLAIKNSGKVVASFFIISASFILLCVANVTIISSINFVNSMTRGYNYNEQGYAHNNNLNIVCDNPLLSAGSKSCYVIDNNNVDWKDNSSRMVPFNMNIKKLSMHNEAEYNDGANKLFNSMINTVKILKQYSVKSKLDIYSFKKVDSETINALSNETMYFATPNTTDKKGWKVVEETFQKLVIKSSLTKSQKDNFNNSFKLYLKEMASSDFQSIGFNFKNVNFKKETYGSEYYISGAKNYPNFYVNTFMDTPNQSDVLNFNDANFNNLFNKYNVPDTNTANKKIIPIIVNKSFGSFTNYTNPNYKAKVGDKFDVVVNKSTSNHKILDTTYEFVIINVYDSFGMAIAWTANKFKPILNFIENQSSWINAEFPNTDPICISRLNYFVINSNYRNYGIYVDGPNVPSTNWIWSGNINEFSLLVFKIGKEFVNGFFNFITKLILIFAFIGILALLISLFCILIFILIILYDDMLIFSVMNVMGYSWKFIIGQMFKMYSMVIALSLIIFIPILNLVFYLFNSLIERDFPLNLSLQYSWISFLVASMVLVAILLFNCFICLKIIKKEKSLKIISENI